MTASRPREDKDFHRFAGLIVTTRLRTKRKDYETAKAIGISPRAFSRYKDPETVSHMSLTLARRMAHAIGCTPEDWLRIGGFAKGGNKDAVDS